MSEPSDVPADASPATEPVEEVETTSVDEVEVASDLGPEPTAEPAAAADPVHTVSRRGAALAMAACLLLGGLVGWLVAENVGDDDRQPISEVRGGRFGDDRSFPGPGGPGGRGFPGPGPGGGGAWHHHHGERFHRWDGPRMDEDGPRDPDGDERGTDDGGDA